MIEPLLQAERLLLHGMVDQAELIYRRIAEQDPRNSIAVVGLARIALERGDDQAALAHARAALSIDPQNDAAVRLEARLSEVAAVRRGAGQERPAEGVPPWSSSGAWPPAADARPSERIVFARNPAMADHRRMEQGPVHSSPAEPAPATSPPEPAPVTPSQEGLLRRLFRRARGGQ